MISLDAKVKKCANLILKEVKVDQNDINKEMALSLLDITVLLQVALGLSSQTRYLEIVLSMIYPVYHLITLVFNIESLFILYHKLFELI